MKQTKKQIRELIMSINHYKLISRDLRMKKILANKSLPTRERIKVIMTDIKSFKHSIALLEGYANGRLRLKGKNYSEYAADYKRTPEDDERYRMTRKQIELQIALLEKEIETLIEYGA